MASSFVVLKSLGNWNPGDVIRVSEIPQELHHHHQKNGNVRFAAPHEETMTFVDPGKPAPAHRRSAEIELGDLRTKLSATLSELENVREELNNIKGQPAESYDPEKDDKILALIKAKDDVIEQQTLTIQKLSDEVAQLKSQISKRKG